MLLIVPVMLSSSFMSSHDSVSFFWTVVLMATVLPILAVGFVPCWSNFAILPANIVSNVGTSVSSPQYLSIFCCLLV